MSTECAAGLSALTQKPKVCCRNPPKQTQQSRRTCSDHCKFGRARRERPGPWRPAIGRIPNRCGWIAGKDVCIEVVLVPPLPLLCRRTSCC